MKYNYNENCLIGLKSSNKDFKLYAVEMVLEDSKKVAEVSINLDLAHQALCK